MTLPNFLVIGAAKCGTDSLCNYLAQHPDVFIPGAREPNFFVADGQPTVPYAGPGDRSALEHEMWYSSLPAYEALFAAAHEERAVGEGTAWYIYYPDALARIKHYVPDARLIAVLRNPVDRAYSAYTMLRRDGREPDPDFRSALAAEDRRTAANWEPIWHYAKMGFYSAQVKRLYDLFDPAQLRIYIYDDYNANPGPILHDAFRFIGVDDTFVPDTSVRYNVSLVPQNESLHQLVAGQNPLKDTLKAVVPSGLRRRMKERIVERNLTRPQPLDPGLRRELAAHFRPDVLELETILGRSLPQWAA
jgi:hypothetical protein